MLTDFSITYADLSDEELLHIASDRSSLRDEAITALDAEMRRRELTQKDVTKHERLVERSRQKEAKKKRRKLFGTRQDRASWVDGVITAFWTLLAFALIASTYAALPQRYHIPPDWEQAAAVVLFATVFIVVVGGSWRKKIAFWISLLISSSVHAVLLHSWILSGASMSGRGARHLAILFGLLLFLVVYGCGFVVRRKLYGEEVVDD